MISTASGTLESNGPNKGWSKDSNCRVLGFTSMTDNAATSPSPSSLGPGGISPLKVRGESLENAINTSNDTTMAEVPMAGTVESQGANG